MPRKDTRTKAERQKDKENAQDLIFHYLPQGSKVWAVRVNRTRSGRESWEFLAVHQPERAVMKVSLSFARLTEQAMDQAYGGVANCDPNQTVYHVALKMYGSPDALTLLKL